MKYIFFESDIEIILNRRKQFSFIRSYQNDHDGSLPKISCYKSILLGIRNEPHPLSYDYSLDEDVNIEDICREFLRILSPKKKITPIKWSKDIILRLAPKDSVVEKYYIEKCIEETSEEKDLIQSFRKSSLSHHHSILRKASLTQKTPAHKCCDRFQSSSIIFSYDKTDGDSNTINNTSLIIITNSCSK